MEELELFDEEDSSLATDTFSTEALLFDSDSCFCDACEEPHAVNSKIVRINTIPFFMNIPHIKSAKIYLYVIIAHLSHTVKKMRNAY